MFLWYICQTTNRIVTYYDDVSEYKGNFVSKTKDKNWNNILLLDVTQSLKNRICLAVSEITQITDIKR